jgi:glutathione S-transferase
VRKRPLRATLGASERFANSIPEERPLGSLTLYQFPASHYNEKARWALDWKGIEHERVSLLPGPHAPFVKRLTGDTQTPVLRDGETVIAGSAAILEHLERRFPEPPLVPADPADRERADAIVRQFDDEVGPAVRLAKFFEVMSGAYALQVFCADRSRLVRGLYRASFPLVSQIMKRSMGIDAERARHARERTRAALDFVRDETAGRQYLVGDRFSVADLTCAALLMPVVDVGALGGPAVATTDEEGAWLARWSDHPGAAWVRDIYSRQRRTR